MLKVGSKDTCRHQWQMREHANPNGGYWYPKITAQFLIPTLTSDFWGTYFSQNRNSHHDEVLWCALRWPSRHKGLSRSNRTQHHLHLAGHQTQQNHTFMQERTSLGMIVKQQPIQGNEQHHKVFGGAVKLNVTDYKNTNIITKPNYYRRPLPNVITQYFPFQLLLKPMEHSSSNMKTFTFIIIYLQIWSLKGIFNFVKH